MDWMGWMKTCLETTTVSSLVIGSPTEEFIPKN